MFNLKVTFSKNAEKYKTKKINQESDLISAVVFVFGVLIANCILIKMYLVVSP